jgi:hypothetical protein
MFKIKDLVGAKQNSAIRGGRLSKFGGDGYRQLVAKIESVVKTMPNTSGRVQGCAAFLHYKANPLNYYVTAIDKKLGIVEGICDNGKSYPFFFSMTLENMLATGVELDLYFSPAVPDLGMR